MQFNLQEIQMVLQQKGYLFFDDHLPFNLNIIGVRNSNTKANTFDDVLYLIYRDNDLELQCHVFPITTDPGTFYLKNPMNKKGTAILMAGQYIGSHRIGLHHNDYDALTQRTALPVWRDNNKDNQLDKNETTDIGFFGINIHRSNPNGISQLVNKWSAGCQVFQNINDFNLFINIAKKAKQLNGNSFTYTLLDEQDFINY